MRSSGLLVALFTLMLVMPLCARAQNGLYVEYGGATLHNSSQPDQYGPTVGIYLENKTLQAIRAGVDFRGSFLSGSNNTSLNTGLAGLRVSIHPKPLPITPYGELMVGISSRSLGSPVTADFATAGILGWTTRWRRTWPGACWSSATAASTPPQPSTRWRSVPAS